MLTSAFNICMVILKVSSGFVFVLMSFDDSFVIVGLHVYAKHFLHSDGKNKPSILVCR